MHDHTIPMGTPYEHENILAMYKDWYEQYFPALGSDSYEMKTRGFRWAQQIRQLPDERVERINKRLDDKRWGHDDVVFPEYSAFAVRAQREGKYNVYLQDEDQWLVDVFENINEEDVILAFEGMVVRHRMFAYGFTSHTSDGSHVFHPEANRMKARDYMYLAEYLQGLHLPNGPDLVQRIARTIKAGITFEPRNEAEEDISDLIIDLRGDLA